jgi:sulfatase maturation enzyme AslB (radical SAM superfamily)
MSKINLANPKPLSKIRIVTIYLGNKCNFDCVYCDRDYIENLGGQAVGHQQVDKLKNFFLWAEQQENDIGRISFHGGEPLLFIKRIYEIMEWLEPIARRNNWLISMTTNGSLVIENIDFFKKYQGILAATVSYDFMYQEVNREAFDVQAMADVLNQYCEQWKWQWVLPIDDRKSFSFENIANFVRTCYTTKCTNVNIIPLRHKRGKDKFEVIVDNIDLKQFYEAFLEFLQILYVKKINVFIDGNYQFIDKAYFSEHSKIILGPDGFIYPEFEWLEYRRDEARTGQWDTDTPVVWKDIGDDDKILSSCRNCASRPSCGLKYMYKMFDEEPKGNCKTFYQIMDFAIMHSDKLKQKKNLVEWVGITDTFEIKK